MKSKNLFMKWNSALYEIERQTKTKNPGKLMTILRSARYADRKDKIMLAVGILSALGIGFIAPFNVFFMMTPVLDILIKVDTPGNPHNITIADQVQVYMNFGYYYLLTGLITLILGITQIMTSEIVSRNIMSKIKTAFLSKMLSIDIGWYDKSQEQYANSVSHDLQKMMILFDSKITTAAEMISFFLFGNIFSLIVAWKIALLTLALLLITIGILYAILKASKKKEKLCYDYIRKSTKIASEILGNTRTVAAYGGEYKEIERYETTLKMANKHRLRHTTMISAGKAFNYFQLCFCYLVAYYFSVRLYLLDDFNPEYIGVILLAQIDAVMNCAYMLSTISDINMATDSAYRIMRFLDIESNYCKSIEDGIKPNTFNAHLTFRNVQFSYPTNLQTKVLYDLTLDIEPGKVTAVVGTSGAGKSTIVSLISRFYDIDAGQILIGGVDLRNLNISWLRDQIGVVRQEPSFFDTSIEENIRYGKISATLEEIIEAAKISYAHEFIKKFPSGYQSIIGEGGIKLSGGQKQRIAIARAILKKPKLLILDEATSALDFNSESIVRKALENAMRGRTSLIIAHRMSTVRKADVIYAMKEGCVVEKGSHSELMELKGYYYSLATVQELDEKDKFIKLNHGSIDKEEILEEAIESINNNLEEAQNEKIRWLSRKNLKFVVLWFLAIFFAVFTSTFIPTFYYIFSQFCESFSFGKDDEISQKALMNVSHLFGLGIIAFFSVILSSVISTIATRLWLEKKLKKTFNKLVSMEISWFDWNGNSPNECLDILTSNPSLIESVTGDKATQVVIFILSIVFTILCLFFLSPSITLVISPIFIIFIIINYLRIKSRESDGRSASLQTKSTKIATEYVQNVKTIQTLNCQEYVIKQYEDLLVCSKKEATVSITWYAVVYGFSKTMLRWLLATTFIYGAHDVAGGIVRGTTLIGLTGALGMVSLLAGPALVLTSQYPAARQAMKQINRIASSKTFLNTMTDQGMKPKISGNIIFQDVTFSYPTREKVQVFNKLNLKIEAGKMVALVGDSGCGKSTIISLLQRFYLHSEGKITIDGCDINDISVRYLRSQMGLVPQEPFLFDMTIKENILYGLDEEVTMDKIIEAAKIANIHDFIMKLPQSYDTSVGERGSKLSGGQRQRIAIARAILRNPKILLLDEATSALDTEIEKAVQEALENACIGRTSIVIAHRLSTIRKADKIIVLQSGAVVEEGNHEELIARKGHYFNLLHR